jgi:sensor c-di-GMP phosphodiesterase-like protein
VIDLSDIEEAIDNDEFYLVYMPTIRLADNVCVGAETLCRWNHDGREIYPDQFIPQCEGTPFLSLLTYWIIERLSEELGDFLRATDNLQVSINTAPDLLGRGGLRYAAKKANLLDIVEKIVIEITERGLADDQAIESLNRFRPRGVKVAIDDFGTGDANLLELSKLSADIIKLDKYFIDQIIPHEPVPRFLKGLVGFAQGMELEIIAEGVETGYQATVLRDLGVQKAQGWLWSKPLQVDDFKAFVAANS